MYLNLSLISEVDFRCKIDFKQGLVPILIRKKESARHVCFAGVAAWCYLVC